MVYAAHQPVHRVQVSAHADDVTVLAKGQRDADAVGDSLDGKASKTPPPPAPPASKVGQGGLESAGWTGWWTRRRHGWQKGSLWQTKGLLHGGLCTSHLC